MSVRFTGRHVGIDEKDREYAASKVEALARFHRHLDDFDVRVSVDGSGSEKVELEASLGRHKAVAVAEAPAFRAALDQAVEALKRQLQKDKEKVVDRRRRPGRRAASSRRGATSPGAELPPGQGAP